MKPREYRPVTGGGAMARLMQATAERSVRTSTQRQDDALDKAAHRLALKSWAMKYRGRR